MSAARNILLLEQDDNSANDIQRFLKVSAYAFNISHASDIRQGLEYVKNKRPDLILLDADFIGLKEFPNFRQAAQKENIPVILLSDSNGAELKASAKLAGANDYLVKNKINLFHLQKSIVNTLDINEAEGRLDDTFKDFTGQQQSLFKVLNKLNAGVLVINETNSIRYANTQAYNLLGDEQLRQSLVEYLHFRQIDEERETAQINNGKTILEIQVSEIEWTGEKGNVFIIDKKDAKESTGFINDDSFLNLANSVSENLIVLKGDRIVYANRNTMRALGLKQNELKHKLLAEIFETPASLFDNITVQSLLSEKQSQGTFKLRDEKELEVNFTLKPMNLDGEFYHLFSFAEIKAVKSTTISEKKEGEFTTEDVLHLASHDLREPVRTILNYVQLAGDNLGRERYDKAKEYNEYALTAAGRMEALLHNLKVYISLNDRDVQHSRVSMKLAVADVLKQLKDTVTASGAEINISELPDVTGDRELIEKLLACLIENAIKFHKKDKKPMIDIGFDKYDGKIVFCIRDNGIGIAKKYQERIFNLFEKLNRVDEYPGNGLGLAISKRIVQMHNGTIWVDSLPGFGSSFYFSW